MCHTGAKRPTLAPKRGAARRDLPLPGSQTLKGMRHAGAKRPTLAGDVELRGVTFRYPARPLVPVFEGFSVHAPPGTMLALVGQSGSGK